MYFKAAQGVDDKVTRSSILYLATLSAHKADQLNYHTEPKDVNVARPQESETPKRVEIHSSSGRLSTVSNDVDIHQKMTEVPRSTSLPVKDLVSDLYILEQKLSQLGIT